MELSVVVVSYNTRDYLARCLDSLGDALERAAVGRGLRRPDFAEVFVVDNASPDGSAGLVRDAYPWVRLIANQQNRGFGAANNQAFRLAAGRYMLLLNPDTEVVGDAIPEMLAYLEAHPDVGVAGGRLRYADGSFQHSAFRFPTLTMAFLDFFPLNHRLTNSRLNGRYPAAAYQQGAFAVDHPLGACMMVRRAVIEQVGGFSEDYFMYCEEIDWCLRIRRAGWEIVCLPTAEFVHHEGRSTRQFRERMYVHLHHSRLTLFRQHYPLWYRLAVRPIVAVGLAQAALDAWRARQSAALTETDYRARLRACLGVAKELVTQPL